MGEMYADTTCEGSGVSVPVLIPQRFVWPYGGTRVFLTGSFTRYLSHYFLVMTTLVAVAILILCYYNATFCNVMNGNSFTNVDLYVTDGRTI